MLTFAAWPVARGELAFIVWGALHGAYLVMEGWFQGRTRPAAMRPRWVAQVRTAARAVVVFIAVTVAWIFFRAPSLGTAFDYFGQALAAPLAREGYGAFVPSLAFAAALLVYEWLTRRWDHGLSIARLPLPARWALYLAFCVRCSWPAISEGGRGSMSSSSYPLLRFLVRAAVFVLVLAGVAEVWTRTVTPSCDVPLSYLETSDSIFRYDPSGPARGTWTIGRFGRRTGEWRVNNHGWISTLDYEEGEPAGSPTIALLGDSYVEGFLTDVDEHIDAYLAQLVTEARVYSFGRSGSYLAQYVATARYAAQFSPDLLIIFLNRRDITSSLKENGVVSPYTWQIESVPGGFAEVPPASVYQVGWKSRLARQSALLGYLIYNAQVPLPDGDWSRPPGPVSRQGYG